MNSRHLAYAGLCAILILPAACRGVNAEVSSGVTIQSDTPGVVLKSASGTDYGGGFSSGSRKRSQGYYTGTQEAGDEPEAKLSDGELIERYTDKLTNGDENERHMAAKKLGAMGPKAKSAVPALLEVLGSLDTPRISEDPEDKGMNERAKDPDSKLEYNCLSALLNIGPAGKTSVPIISKSLNSYYYYTRVTAARALGKIGPSARESVPQLIELLKRERSGEVAYEILVALGKIGPDAKGAVPALKGMLKEGSPMKGQISKTLALINTGAGEKKAMPSAGLLPVQGKD